MIKETTFNIAFDVEFTVSRPVSTEKVRRFEGTHGLHLQKLIINEEGDQKALTARLLAWYFVSLAWPNCIP
jgi:hypothetical protein